MNSIPPETMWDDELGEDVLEETSWISIVVSWKFVANFINVRSV